MSIRDEIKVQWRSGGAVKRLLFINIGVFLAIWAVEIIGWLSGTKGLSNHVLHYLTGTSNGGELVRRPWTPITYMFTHQAPMHLFWNMLMFWFSGQLFESLLGAQRLVGNYILGGLAGFAFYALGSFMPAHLELGGQWPILGASAAVMSVFIGVATYRPNVQVALFLVGQVRLKYVAIAILLLDLIAIRNGDNTGGHLAHLGGALYGFVAARQLQQGRDLSLGFVRALQRIGAVFTPGKGPRMRVAKKPARRTAPVVLDEQFNAAKRDKQARVDSILDKISRSGYDSLSKEERDFLFRASHEK